MENSKTPIVEESADYDNCIGFRDESAEPPTLTRFLVSDDEVELDDQPEDDGTWKDHWVGMPPYVQEDKKTFKTIYVHFRTKEDYDEFATLVNQNLSEKTKSIWYPKLERDQNSLKRWIEE